MAWFQLQKGQYQLRMSKESTCQVEIECDESAVVDLPIEGQWSKIAPLRIMSFDIECSAQHGFPNADRDQIIQIACVCSTAAAKEEDQYRVVFVLNGCSSISGAEVKEAKTESVLLEEF